MYASEGRMKGSGQWPKWDIPIYTTKRRCNFLFLIRYQDYDAVPSYSSKCFHNLEKEVQRIKQHVSGHTAAGRSMPKVQASFPSSSVARLSHWPCVPGELHMLGCERARLGIWNVCLTHESEGSVLGENPLFFWTCLSRRICIMMTINNYIKFFNLKDLKLVLDCKYSSAFCLVS